VTLSRALLVALSALSVACGARGQKAPEPARIVTTEQLPRSVVASGPERCADAIDDNGNGLADEGCGIPTGLIQFLVAWDEPSADVDLRVTDPDGELSEVGRPTESGLVKERDCPGRNGECRGKNYENVYLEDGDLLRGKYRIRVRLESTGGADPPIRVRLSARLGPRSYGASFAFERPDTDWETVLGL
jgi:tRNA (guanosine-2'-O-)-methyltransferase